MQTLLLRPKIRCLILLLAGLGFLLSCSKSGFLDKKPSTDLIVPGTLADFQALLENDLVMRETPVLGELSADNFYLADPGTWQNLDTKQKNAYIWAPDIYQGQGKVEDWDLPYQQVYCANLVLDGLPGIKIDTGNILQWKTLEGTALFIRAYAFYNLAQLFAPAYDAASAATDLGIPIRLHSDVMPVSVRATVDSAYKQILWDLKQASGLLPAAVPHSHLNRPSRPAALAMLARVCLSMRNYPQAGLYADSCLQLYRTLLNYGTVDTTSFLPFSTRNVETLYQSRLLTSSLVLVGLATPSCVVDSGLYRSYAKGDLRPAVYYTSSGLGPVTRGSYNGSIWPFSGLATDEVWLVRAECKARAGDKVGALNDLDTLMKNRWDSSFVPFTATTPAEALSTILSERRKELAFRGLRWTDLRRLNKEGANIILHRVLNGQFYQLSSNDPRYILPIPPDVIALSGMPQNPR